MTIPAGAQVRVKRNDCNVPVGTEGIVAYIHPESRLPVVRTETGRPVAFTPEQLEILVMPEQTIEQPASKPNGKVWDWTVFDPRTVAVTLNPSSVRLNAAAAELLVGTATAPPRVRLLYDRGRSAIALQPTNEPEQTFRVSRNSSGWGVSAREFLKLIDFSSIRMGKPLKLPATWDAGSGLLVVTGVPFRKDAA